MKTVETRDEEREEEGVWGVEDEEDEEISNQIEFLLTLSKSSTLF